MLNQSFGQALADEDGRFIQVDRMLCGLLGFDTQALLARNMRDITHPDDLPSSQPLLERLRSHDEPFTLVQRYLRADGTPVWVQNYVSMLRDTEGRGAISTLIRPVLPLAAEANRRGGAAVPPGPWKGHRRGMPSAGLLH